MESTIGYSKGHEGGAGRDGCPSTEQNQKRENRAHTWYQLLISEICTQVEREREREEEDTGEKERREKRTENREHTSAKIREREREEKRREERRRGQKRREKERKRNREREERKKREREMEREKHQAVLTDQVPVASRACVNTAGPAASIE